MQIVQKSNILIVGFILLLGGFFPSYSQDSATSNRMAKFSKRIIEGLKIKTLPGIAIGIAAFDDQSTKAKDKKMGISIANILTDNFVKDGSFHIVESQQIKKILKNIELGQTGLYDSDKVASVGNLVGAKYLIVGTVTYLGGFYHISARAIEVETGTIAYSDTLEIDSKILEDQTKMYQPPTYRLYLGSGVVKVLPSSPFKLTPEIIIGFGLEIFPKNIVLLQVVDSIQYSIQDKTDNSIVGIKTDRTISNYEIAHLFQFSIGYGFLLNVSQYLTLRPSVNMGMSIGNASHEKSYQFSTNPPNISDSFAFTEQANSFNSFFISPSIDFIIVHNSPISFFLSVGFTQFLKSIDNSYRDVGEKSVVSSVGLRAGIGLYF